jgi:hypothetical protein
MVTRRRLKQKLSLRDRLAYFSMAARERASFLSPGAEKEELLRKARQADTTAHLEQRCTPAGSQPTK